jgi:hypothetical protein
MASVYSAVTATTIEKPLRTSQSDERTGRGSMIASIKSGRFAGRQVPQEAVLWGRAGSPG